MDQKEEEMEHRSRHMGLIIDLARRNKLARAKVINEIAEWMAAEVKLHGKLDHHDAASAIRRRLPYLEMIGGRGLILVEQEHHDRTGAVREVLRFGSPVLEAFRDLTGKSVRWGKANRYWIAVKSS
jgi:hypothetical protein